MPDWFTSIQRPCTLAACETTLQERILEISSPDALDNALKFFSQVPHSELIEIRKRVFFAWQAQAQSIYNATGQMP